MKSSVPVEMLSYARGPVRPPPALPAPPAIRKLCLVGFWVAGLTLAYVGWRYIRIEWPDFEYFYKAGAWLLAHGGLDRGVDLLSGGQVEPRGSIEWYLPFVSRVMTVIAWMPYQIAGVVWVIINTLAMLATARLIGRNLLGLPPRDWPVTMIVPFLFLVVFWYWEFRQNQLDTLTLLLVVASFVHWEQRRHGLAGFWVGLAMLIKLTPGLLILWFALKRQFRVVGVAILTFMLAGPVSDLIVFGPEGAVGEYRKWLSNAVHHSSHRGLILRQREMDWRNQSLGAVASRWLHPTNYATHFDNDPRAGVYEGERFVNVLHLSRQTVVWVVMGVVGLSLAGLVILARRPAQALSLWQLRAEWALFVLAMLWFMPVMRRYHMIWALPAMAILAASIHHVGRRRRWSVLALVCMFVVVAGQASLPLKEYTGTHITEAIGLLLGGVLALGVALVVGLLWWARDPTAIPDDSYTERAGPGARPDAAPSVRDRTSYV